VTCWPSGRLAVTWRVSPGRPTGRTDLARQRQHDAAVEDAFGIEFPERLLRKSTFASIAAIVAAVDEVGASS
jgi:hypothetical protein